LSRTERRVEEDAPAHARAAHPPHEPAAQVADPGRDTSSGNLIRPRVCTVTVVSYGLLRGVVLVPAAETWPGLESGEADLVLVMAAVGLSAALRFRAVCWTVRSG